MFIGKRTTLSRMQTGQRGVVVQIRGGRGMVSRISVLGIRPGKRIAKVSSMLMRGPVTIQIDTAQVAIGYGMANRIIIDLD
jgi:Fe2+ transport system protein A